MANNLLNLRSPLMMMMMMMMILVILEMMIMLVNLCCLEVTLDLPPLLLLIILLTPLPVQVFVFFFFNFFLFSAVQLFLHLLFVTCPGCPPAHPVSAPALSSPSTSGRPDNDSGQEFCPVSHFMKKKTFSSAACSSSLALLFTSWM